MDRIKEKMQALRVEADQANTNAEESAAKVKALEQDNLKKEQDITSLTHKLQVAEADIEKLEESVGKHKNLADAGHSATSQNENLTRRVQVLEEELEQADKNLREVVEKHRQTDVKAGHYERKVQALEQSVAQWETKYEELEAKYKESQSELDKFAADLNTL